MQMFSMKDSPGTRQNGVRPASGSLWSSLTMLLPKETQCLQARRLSPACASDKSYSQYPVPDSAHGEPRANVSKPKLPGKEQRRNR